MPTDNPSLYGSYMNFFLPKSAQVGGPSLAPTLNLYDMLPGNLASSMAGSPPGTPEEEQKKQQERQKQQEQQKQMLALGQQGMKMLQPQPPPQAAPPPPMPMMQTAAPPPQQMPAPPQQPRAPIGGYDPRDPRSRNPMAGMPTPFGNLYR